MASGSGAANSAFLFCVRLVEADEAAQCEVRMAGDVLVHELEEAARDLARAGSVKYFSQKSLRGLARTKSASNGGVLRGDLQVLHVHVLLVAPLSTGYMTQSGTN